MDKLLQEVSDIRGGLDHLTPLMTDRLYEILSRAPNRVVASAVIQTLYLAQERHSDFQILYYGGMLDAFTRAYGYGSPFMYILDIFNIKDVGVVVTGYLIAGQIEIEDKLCLLKADGRNIELVCTGVEETLSRVYQIFISPIAMTEISQGDCLVKYSL
ncbi:hypothetical protein ACFJ92_004523 [Vibrio parahaemolyticus]|nr:hypothetical protein [Vibrio parahaemolyticus]ELR9975077.1 hypothetical protein [Vibrio parahaemolyticus]MBE3740186.1 hypothetical protein [Vibrio parahaemolyticus]HCG8153888.1 hypothetical protein [Vibrio parahaemolyticus]